MNNMNIIITGSKGAVGSELINLFKNKFNNIIGIQRTPQKSDISNIHYYMCNDLSQEDLAKQTFDNIINKFRRVDILINVAGGFDMGSNVENVKDWDHMMKINFYTMLNATLNVLPNMKINKFGRIVNFGSETAYNGMALATPYCVSKAAVQSFSQSLSLELSGNITCNTLVPSIINTKANQAVMPDNDYSQWTQIEDIAGKISDIIKQDYSGSLISF